MSTFRHHPDGIIFIDNLQIPLEKFMELQPEYALPIGATRQEYVQGVRHSVYFGDKQKGGTFPWPEGNAYISKKAEYAAAITPEVEIAEPTRDEKVADEVFKSGYDVQKTIEALVRAVGMNDRTLLDDLIKKIGEAETKFPEAAEANPITP